MEETGIYTVTTGYGLHASTYILCLISGFIPIVNAEIFLIGLSSMITKPVVLPLSILAAFGQMTAKAIFYLSGRGILKISPPRYENKLNETKAKLIKWESKSEILIFLSAFIGLPPFYFITFASGIIRMNFFRFFMSGFAGRFLRFGAIMLFPHLFKEIF